MPLTLSTNDFTADALQFLVSKKSFKAEETLGDALSQRLEYSLATFDEVEEGHKTGDMALVLALYDLAWGKEKDDELLALLLKHKDWLFKEMGMLFETLIEFKLICKTITQGLYFNATRPLIKHLNAQQSRVDSLEQFVVVSETESKTVPEDEKGHVTESPLPAMSAAAKLHDDNDFTRDAFRYLRNKNYFKTDRVDFVEHHRNYFAMFTQVDAVYWTHTMGLLLALFEFQCPTEDVISLLLKHKDLLFRELKLMPTTADEFTAVCQTVRSGAYYKLTAHLFNRLDELQKRIDAFDSVAAAKPVTKVIEAPVEIPVTYTEALYNVGASILSMFSYPFGSGSTVAQSAPTTLPTINKGPGG